MACKRMKEVQTSKSFSKTPFLKYEIVKSGHKKFEKCQKCKLDHEKLRARA